MTALKEIARVLQPTGVFGVIWNIEDCKSATAVQLVSIGLRYIRQTTHRNRGTFTQAGKAR